MDNKEDIINQKMSELLKKMGVNKNSPLIKAAEEAGIYKQPLANLDQFITQDLTMNYLKNKVRKLVGSNINILIVGESGTGKELIANALHGKRQGNFVAVSCAGIPNELLESEFFGTMRGSFTSSIRNTDG